MIKRFSILMAAVLMVFCTSDVRAEDPVIYSCDIKNITVLLLPNAAGQTGYRYMLHGVLETPTPGYQTTWHFGDVVDGHLNATLKLSGPEGMALTVIDKVTLDEIVTFDKPLNAVDITIEKHFNWGPTSVKCAW